MIWKVFSFKFVIVFSSLFYYAFNATPSTIEDLDVAQEAAEDSMFRIAVSLLCFITVSHWFQKYFIQLWLPRGMYKWRIFWRGTSLRDERESLQTSLHNSGHDKNTRTLQNQRRYLKQASSKVWDEVMMKGYDTFDDYTILLVQFGYVACFSMVFPLVPLLSLLNAVVQIRMDAYKLCRTRQRPIAEKSGSIGVWDNVLQLMVVCAVITNCSMIGFTSLQLRINFPGLSSMHRALFMIMVEHILLFIGYLMQVIYPRALNQNRNFEPSNTKALTLNPPAGDLPADPAVGPACACA